MRTIIGLTFAIFVGVFAGNFLGYAQTDEFTRGMDNSSSAISMALVGLGSVVALVVLPLFSYWLAGGESEAPNPILFISVSAISLFAGCVAGYN